MKDTTLWHADKGSLQKRYRDVVHRYVEVFILMYFADNLSDFNNYGWVGDEIGGVLCVNDDMFFNFNDIKYCVDYDVADQDLFAWYDYCSRLGMIDRDIPTPNLRNWCWGCPRKTEEEIQELERLHANVEEAKELLRQAIKNNLF